MSVKLSIIIPCYNEAAIIKNCVNEIIRRSHNLTDLEIIIADGQSTDGTVDKIAELPVILVRCSTRGRANQMNAGAAQACGNILYFLHADTIPAMHFDKIILDNTQSDSGCFRLKFDSNNWFLKLNAWFSRFNINIFRFGDQSLFIHREAFIKMEGFSESNLVFEDQEIVKRIRKQYRFKILPFYVTTSSRMYSRNGIYFTQFYYFYLFILYKLGVSQRKILKKYTNRLSKGT